MSARWPSRGVSTNASEPASRTMLAIVSGSIMPASKLACRSAPESKASRLLFAWTKSIRPVMARTRSTIPASSSPPAYACQVSRQNPGPNSPIASQSRARRSNRRVIALLPPAVFSIKIGSGNPPSSRARERVLRQLS